MPTLLTSPPLERVLQQLHDSEINAGVQTFYDAGMRVGSRGDGGACCAARREGHRPRHTLLHV
jgi:uncharacterized Zn-binding protein involved in type VI secretion